MNALTRVLAKSAQAGRQAETLTAHLGATLDAAIELRRRLGTLAVADDVLGEQFWYAVLLAGLTHDAGKIAAGFQDMVTGRSRSWGQRHEVVSLGVLPLLIEDEWLRLWVATAVVTHHRPLTGDEGIGRRSLSIESHYGGYDVAGLRKLIGPVDPGLADALAAWLAARASAAGITVTQTAGMTAPDMVGLAHPLLAEVLRYWTSGMQSEEQGLAAVLLQGAVTLADHLSSAHGTLDTGQPLGAGFRPALQDEFAQAGKVFHQHQLRAADVRGHLLLRAPTGSGKTEAGLLWASEQVVELTRKVGGVPRVFFTLPYLASINAMATRLGFLLDDPDVIGISHSRSASYHLSRAISPEDADDEEARARAARKAVSRAAATRLFRETIRVGTPYQLLRGALAGPIHAGILIDAANSVFVLDEIHAYEPERLGYILATARLWERLGGRIAVLSATLPDVLADLITETLHDPVETVVAPAGLTPRRHRLAIRGRSLADKASISEIRDRLAAGQAVLVVANNVAQAQQLFAELAPTAEERHGPDAAILLHSRFRRVDRLRIERKINDRYGTEASRKGRRASGLVVATQVVEVSLDVDFDVLFTSAAPLEALLQRFGRINRLALRAPADVIVHEATFAPRRGGSGPDFADGVYPREPVEAGWLILQRHDGQAVDEAQATDWLNDIYAMPWGEKWRADVRGARDVYQDAFLTFTDPFDDRRDLGQEFDAMFDGTEAVLVENQAAYEAALTSADRPAEGRLVADDYLIPMPGWARTIVKYDRALGVNIVDGEYDEQLGLLSVRGVDALRYQPGELI